MVIESTSSERLLHTHDIRMHKGRPAFYTPERSFMQQPETFPQEVRSLSTDTKPSPTFDPQQNVNHPILAIHSRVDRTLTSSEIRPLLTRGRRFKWREGMVIVHQLREVRRRGAGGLTNRRRFRTLEESFPERVWDEQGPRCRVRLGVEMVIQLSQLGY